MGGSEKQTVTLRGVVTANSATDIYSAETAVGTADSPFIRVALTENRTEGNADFEIPSVQTFAAGAFDCIDLRVEDEGVFYIDKYGRIAAYRRELPGSYAYVYKENLPKYVDHVYVREYNGIIEDVVIVKAPKKVSVR